MRFLVVEDEELSARAMRRLLTPFGEVTLAPTAREAERLLDGGNEWSAFFIDVGLPDGCGIDILAKARIDYPSTPAMVVTGCMEAHAINAAFDLDAAYVIKPIARARLAHFLSTHPPFAIRLAKLVDEWRARYGLSEAERDVLMRAGIGESRDAISIHRECSALTIKTHVANLLRKTGDDSLLHAAARLLRELAGDARSA